MSTDTKTSWPSFFQILIQLAQLQREENFSRNA